MLLIQLEDILSIPISDSLYAKIAANKKFTVCFQNKPLIFIEISSVKKSKTVSDHVSDIALNKT